MHILHKIPEGFIVCSDEKPKGSDLIMWTGETVEHFPKQGTPNIKYGCVVESVNYSGTTHEKWKKVIAQQHEIDFSGLSEEEQKEIGLNQYAEMFYDFIIFCILTATYPQVSQSWEVVGFWENNKFKIMDLKLGGGYRPKLKQKWI
jgi:hypothetical protein